MAIEAEKEAPKKKMLAAAGAAAPKNNKANKSKTIEAGGIHRGPNIDDACNGRPPPSPQYHGHDCLWDREERFHATTRFWESSVSSLLLLGGSSESVPSGGEICCS